MHALRGDSLGETARRQHVKCLARAWKAEERAKRSAKPRRTT
ncbi:hypothetical protein [Streptomyces lydicus]